MGFDPGSMLMLAAQLLPQLMNGGGQKDKLKQVPTKSKGQMGALDESLARLHEIVGPGFENAIGLLQGMLDPQSEVYKNFEAPYMQQFNQQIIPGLSEQFAGLNGMGGGLQSSGFGQALGAAGGNLETSLAQMKSGMQMNAANSLLGQYNTQFGQSQAVDPFAYTYRQGSPSMGQSMAQGAAQGVGQYGANAFMNRNQNSGNSGQYPTQNPLTNTYDQLFRSGAMR